MSKLRVAGFAIAVVVASACSSGSSGGLPEAGTIDASVGFPEVSFAFDSAVPAQTFDGSVPDVAACTSVRAAAGTPGDTCLARQSLGACATLCDAGALYSCLASDLPPEAGTCVEVDAGVLTASGTRSLCCGTPTCVRYSVADPTCNINTSGKAAWSCPNDDAGASGPGPGATSTGDAPTSDTVIWCL